MGIREKEGTRPLQSLVQAFAIAMISFAIASISISFSLVQGQILTLQQQPQIETLADNTLSLEVHFSNNTNATLVNESITQEQGNLIVQSINTILLDDEEALEELEPLAESEIEEEEVEESDGDGGGSNGNDNGDGNDEEESEELEEPILPGPGPIPGPGDEREGATNDSGELGLELKCGAAYPTMVGSGPPEECQDKYLEAVEKAQAD